MRGHAGEVMMRTDGAAPIDGQGRRVCVGNESLREIQFHVEIAVRKNGARPERVARFIVKLAPSSLLCRTESQN